VHRGRSAPLMGRLLQSGTPAEEIGTNAHGARGSDMSARHGRCAKGRARTEHLTLVSRLKIGFVLEVSAPVPLLSTPWARQRRAARPGFLDSRTELPRISRRSQRSGAVRPICRDDAGERECAGHVPFFVRFEAAIARSTAAPTCAFVSLCPFGCLGWIGGVRLLRLEVPSSNHLVTVPRL
jgi:hypothetical protein